MKKLYTLGIALSMVAFGTQSFAQLQSTQVSSESHAVKVESTEVLTKTHAIETEASAKKTSPTQKDDEVVYFAEDFSNGMDGQGENGPWTVGEAQGSLWFATHPAGEGVEGGYDPDAAILGGTHPLYGTKLPLFSSSTPTTPTAANGYMMIDVDRWNSLSTVENPLQWPGSGEFNEDDYLNSDSAKATLISPAINLTGLEFALLTFYQNGRLCCSGYKLSVEVSVDGQVNWTSYDVFTEFGGVGNDPMPSSISVNISDALQDAADLSNVFIRFFWAGKQSEYQWIVDDVKIIALPDNNLIAGRTFMNDWATLLPTPDDEGFIYITDLVPFAQYFNAFGYENQPEYYTRPFNFGMEVENDGAAVQTDVKLKVVATSPSGATHTWYSEPIEIEAQVTDTLWINNALLSDFPGGMIEVGKYDFTYKVEQAEVDGFPEDNTGTLLSSWVSDEAGNNGRAIMQNANVFGYVYVPGETGSPLNGRDQINSTGYVFPALESGFGPKFITHVEAAFTGPTGTYKTVPGNAIYFNVRKNHAYDEVEGDESTYAVPFFGNDPLLYEDEELEHIIAPADLPGPNATKWVSFELPTPIAIEPGVVYMSELRIPPAGGPIVYLQAASGPKNERFGSLAFSGEQWSISPPTLALRFRTSAEPSGIEKISVESGLTLIQNYPNPFTDMTKIQYMVDKSSKVNFEVRDLTGKLVYTKDLGNVPANAPQTIELQRGNLAAGMYTYTIATSEFQVSRKLTVQ